MAQILSRARPNTAANDAAMYTPTQQKYDIRDKLTVDQSCNVEYERKMIVRELKMSLSREELLAIKTAKRWNLWSAHSALTRCIVAEYELNIDGHHITQIWRDAEARYPLVNIARTACEFHPCEPTNFALSCIKRLWENLQVAEFIDTHPAMTRYAEALDSFAARKI
jgi:hypothetical protein